ncbi:MAG: arsenate reductase ArsC [Sedimentisphaerales bacterium]|nr:arsenate reductase ArsC [Sedimentisphaerales bacterium]
MDKKKKVMFYCKHNSCRSQMAEGYLRKAAGDRFDVYSAGLSPRPIHELVYSVMSEVGISLDNQTSKGVDHYLGKDSFDYIIIVCNESEAECPRLYPFALNLLRWPMPDPAASDGEDLTIALDEFRKTRDMIIDKIDEWLGRNP